MYSEFNSIISRVKEVTVNKGKDKAKLGVDFEILQTGIVDSVICTRLPIEEATKRLNAESPTGTSHPWFYDGKDLNHNPCPDGQGKTHYRLFC